MASSSIALLSAGPELSACAACSLTRTSLWFFILPFQVSVISTPSKFWRDISSSSLGLWAMRGRPKDILHTARDTTSTRTGGIAGTRSVYSSRSRSRSRSPLQVHSPSHVRRACDGFRYIIRRHPGWYIAASRRPRACARIRCRFSHYSPLCNCTSCHIIPAHSYFDRFRYLTTKFDRKYIYFLLSQDGSASATTS